VARVLNELRLIKAVFRFQIGFDFRRKAALAGEWTSRRHLHHHEGGREGDQPHGQHEQQSPQDVSEHRGWELSISKRMLIRAARTQERRSSPSVAADFSVGRGKNFVAEPSNRGGVLAIGSESLTMVAYGEIGPKRQNLSEARPCCYGI